MSIDVRGDGVSQFSNFLDQIPNEIKSNVETHTGNQIILFKPHTYIANVKTQIVDYHFALPSSETPPTMFDKRRAQIGRNRLMAVNPGTSILCMENRPTQEYYALSIKSDFVAKIAREMEFSQEVRFSKVDNPCSIYLRQAVYNLERENKSYGDNCSLMYESLAIQITALLLREVDSNLRNVPSSLDDGKHFVETAIDYMNTFFYSNIKIDDICREIYVTPYHFIRIFKEKTGVTPHEYLLGIRMERARDLLKSRRYSVTDAAKMCGFISVSHFSYVFRKSMGISPGEYRKLYFMTNK